MSDAFLGQISVFAFQFVPAGYAACDGALMPINQYQALFSLLGTTYGGDGETTFGLPDLRGRVPVHFDTGYSLGARSGQETVALTTSQLPAHSHGAFATEARADSPDPTGRMLAAADAEVYTAAGQPVGMAALGSAGSNSAHDNMQPYLVVNFCIAMSGIFPSSS